MSPTGRKLSLIILTLFMIVSCGSDNDDDDNTPVTNRPDDREEEEDENRTIRYTSVVLEENCGYWTDCDFTVRGDFNRRPVLLIANFVDNGFPTDQPAPEGETDSIDEGTCNFTVTLSESEADRLEAAADKLRFCRVENNPTADRGFDGLFATSTSGVESMVYKYRDGGQEEEGKISYICAGRATYYKEVEKLIVPKAPAECPNGYKRLFR